MYFDTLDICSAHFLYAMLWHERIGFRPSSLLNGPEDLTENAREIYNNLCAD
jgi:hypothetical protein